MKKKPEPDYDLLPDVDLQNTVNRHTFYANKAIEKARKNLARCEVDAEREARCNVYECKMCFYLRGARLAGQAFTDRPCDICAKVVTYSSTATMKYCKPCAEKHQLCRECGGDLELRTREDVQAPRLKGERSGFWKRQEGLAKARQEAWRGAHTKRGHQVVPDWADNPNPTVPTNHPAVPDDEA